MGRIADVRAKVARAEKHFEDLQVALAPFGERHKYPVRQGIEGKNKNRRLILRLDLSKVSVPAECPVIAGDLVHNLRSALDYLIYALNPPANRNSGLAFPIFEHNVWQRDSARRYLKRDAGSIASRKNFRRWTRDIHPKAREAIKRLQPCIYAPDKRRDYVLLTLSRLNNADKHRKLMMVVSGLRDGDLIYVDPITQSSAYVASVRPAEGRVLGDGTELRVAQTLPANVDVYVRGTVAIAFGNSHEAGLYEGLDVFQSMIQFVTLIVDALEDGALS